MNAAVEMPKYKCHKEVWALKIKAIARDSEKAREEQRETDGSAIITPEEDRYAPFKVDANYMNKHKPEVGGYYVVYADGYKSFSPASAFDGGYTPMNAVKFANPIEQEIQAKGLTAPRITPEDIDENIVGERYFTAADAGHQVTDEMVNRFLSWKLPKDFHPDAGISFKADFNEGTQYPMKHEPTGTNLFHAGQVKEMLEHVLQPAPYSQAMSLLTFCVLELRNGFTVTGESACASPENFDAELGRKIARRNAEAKIWPLMGYHLRTMLKRQEEAAELRGGDQ